MIRLIYPILLLVLTSCSSRYSHLTRRSNKAVPIQAQSLTQKEVSALQHQQITDAIINEYADLSITNPEQTNLVVTSINSKPSLIAAQVNESVLKNKLKPQVVASFQAFGEDESQTTSYNPKGILWVFLAFLVVIIIVVEILLPGYGIIGLILLLGIALLGFIMYKTGMVG
ncbi:MAG: hypothetical protein JXR19_05140 [Bacteroidia bacterium]